MSRTRSSASESSVEVSRVISGTPESVFKAWTEPRTIRRWFTSGNAMPHCDFVAQEGRAYSLGFIDHGRTGTVTGTVLEVVANQRLKYTWTVSGDPDEAKDSIVTVDFRAVPGGTEVSVRHERLTTARARKDTLGGWTEIVELLDQMSQVEGLEEQIRESKRKLAAMRRDLPHMRVADTQLLRPDGTPAMLSQLFGDRDELILIHNMGKSCAYCTLWADGFNGVWRHMNDRAPLALISPDAPQVQREFAASRGWTFPMFSTHGTELARQLGFESESGDPWPGASTLRQDADGTIWRTAQTHFGPGDDYCAVWHFFDLLDRGANGWRAKYQYPRDLVGVGVSRGTDNDADTPRCKC